MPNEFIQSPNGLLYVFSGMDPVLRWDGSTVEMQRAGVVGPEVDEQLTISSSGVGSLRGTYTAYTRYVDGYGNVSNLSPISESVDLGGGAGTITNVFTGPTPIRVLSSGHGLATGDIVNIEGVTGVAQANGTFNVQYINESVFALRLNNNALTPVSSDGSYNGGGTWESVSGAEKVVYSNVPVPTDPKVVRRQILRNTDGQALVYYIDVDTEDLNSTSFESTRTDAELSTQTAVVLTSPAGRDLAVAIHTPPSDDRPVVAHLLGRLFLAGVVPYRQGAVKMTFGSKTVTGIGTEWTEVMPGRYLHVDGARKEFEINDMDVAAQTLELVEEYTGADDEFATYAIWPAQNRRYGIDFSEAGLEESVSPLNSFTLENDEGDGDVTALLVINSRLYVVQEKRLRVLSFLNDPSPNESGGDGSLFPRDYRGAVNQRCPVIVEDAAYLLDSSGVHSFSGNSDRHISTPVQPFFRTGSGDELSIDYTHKSFFHGVQDEANEIIYWFVSTSPTQRYPHHALCFNYRDNAWWIEEYSVPICCSTRGRLNGRPTIFVGSTGGRIFALDRSELDGPDPGAGDTRGTATSSTLMTLVDSAASFPASGVVGSPLFIVDGTGKGQRRIVTAVSGTTLTIDQPWTTALDTTSVYQIGGIDWKWKSNVFRYVPLEENTVRRVELLGQPTPSAQSMDARLYQNRLSTPVNMGVTSEADDVQTVKGEPDVEIDLTRADGYWTWRFDGLRQEYQDGARFLELELSGVKGKDPQRFYAVTLDGVIQ